MTESVRRRTTSSRLLAALGGVALLALLLLAALLLGGASSDGGETSGSEAHDVAVSAVGGHDDAVSTVHAYRRQPSTRVRSVAYAVLAAAASLAAWAFLRLRFARAGRLRTLRIFGLPPGRAPPTLGIA